MSGGDLPRGAEEERLMAMVGDVTSQVAKWIEMMCICAVHAV
jgi:hypothetical protein